MAEELSVMVNQEVKGFSMQFYASSIVGLEAHLSTAVFLRGEEIEERRY